MPESGSLLPLVRKYFEHDIQGAAHSLEWMSEEEAVSVLKALPASLAVRAVQHLQVSYAAELLRDADPALSEAIILVGVLNMRDLMLSDPEASLESVMRRDVFTLQGFTDREEAANELARRRYFSAPIVDNEGKILGIIKAEQLIQGVREEITEDMQLMFGVSGDERVSSSFAFSLRKRLPWLHVNLATAFLAASVVAAFESIIAKLTVLAVFLPVVAGQGGNAGAQSMAVVMRGLVMREIPRSRILAVFMKEGRLGAINGLVTGAVTAIVAWLWNGNPYLGLVIGLGMFINLFIAGLSGASVPILMKRLGLDPAQCSSIILTTITDVMGFAAFLGLALLFIDFLV